MKQGKRLKVGGILQRSVSKSCEELPPEKRRLYQDYIEEKKALSITRDIVFKKIFDPDVHPDRLSKFLSLILGFDIEVVGSSKNESIRDSIFDKGIVMDVNARVKGGENIIVEMQVGRQEFIGKRAAVISASSLKSQYSSMKLGRKREMRYDQLKKVYTIFIMVNSPSFFKGSKGNIHFYKQASKTGPELDLLQEYLFIELRDYLKDEVPIENEVDAWLWHLLLQTASKPGEGLLPVILSLRK